MTITTVVQENSGLAIKECEFDELFRLLINVKLAITQSDTIDCLIEQKMGKFLERRTLPVDGIPHFLYLDTKIKYYDIPLPISKGSGGVYHIKDFGLGLLLQLLSKDRYSSCNFHTRNFNNDHNNGSEYFYPLTEGYKMCTCSYNERIFNGEKNLKPKEVFSVGSYECHRGYALSNSVLNIILMPPGAGVSDHNYPEICIRTGEKICPYVRQKTA